MNKPIDNKTDIIINHRLGCLVINILFALMFIALAVVYYVYVKDGEAIYKYLIVPGMALGGIYAIYYCITKIIRERANKIPAMTITSKSLILTRTKDEYNEIPFEAIDHFEIWHRRRGGRSNSTYIGIKYKPDFDYSTSKFERVKDIDCSGFNMLGHNILKRLKERLEAYNQANAPIEQ